MYLPDEYFIVDQEKIDKIKKGTEDLKIKIESLNKILPLFKKYDGRKINKRNLEEIKEEFNSDDLKMYFVVGKYIDISIYGKILNSDIGGSLLRFPAQGKGEKFDFSEFEKDRKRQIRHYEEEIKCISLCLQTLSEKMQRLKKLLKEAKEICDPIPYKITEEFDILRKIKFY